MHFKKLLFAALFSSLLLNAENSIGLNINDKDLELQASVNLFSTYEGDTGYILDGSYLNTNIDKIFCISIIGENTFQGSENLSLGFGAKVVFTQNFVATPLLAKAHFVLPINANVPTTSINTSLAYAPSILSFTDAKNYTEFRIEADIEIISNIHIFTGYRNIDTRYKTYDKIFNSSFYGGMKLNF